MPLTCAVFIAATLDGYIARRDGGLDFLDRVQREGEDYGYSSFFAACDALVIGRKTYDTALGFPDWPYKGKRCLVLTHRPAASRYGEEFTDQKPRALLDWLGQQGVRTVYVDGGDVIRQFLAEKLVDELTLSIVPMLLGDGVPLFGPGLPELPLELVSSRSWPSGLVQLHYRRG